MKVLILRCVLVNTNTFLVRQDYPIATTTRSYINYKSLKKVIKSLAAGSENETLLDQNGNQQTRLQANKATFFFKLERELDKVNSFYEQREAELRTRLNTLVEKRKVLQAGNTQYFRTSANFVVLQEGFQQFERDLNKLQQYVELNATGFYKALKKWDKRSKSHTKELYLSRRVEIQPVFDRDVLSNLVDTATTILLELEAFANGETSITHTSSSVSPDLRAVALRAEDDLDSDILRAVVSGSPEALKDIMSRLGASSSNNVGVRLSRIFMQAISRASDSSLQALVDTGSIDFAAEDEISGRICIHEAVLSGRKFAIQLCLSHISNLAKMDVYGRTALHYACLQPASMADINKLLLQNNAPVNVLDHNVSTPLHYAILQNNLETVRLLLTYGAQVNPKGESEYVPLSMACSQGNPDMVKLLLEHGAQTVYNSEGLLPLHLVARAGHAGLCALLCSFGSDIEARDKFSGWTPIFFAASEGHVDVLKELIECGSQVALRDDDHHSPTYYAAWEGHKLAMQVLLDAGCAFGNTESSLGSLEAAPTGITKDARVVKDEDGIPSLLLPPPILPVRSYGHNYLEKTTFLQINLHESAANRSPVEWYLDETLFSSSKLSVSLKSTRRGNISELIPYTVSLPMIDESESFTFQVDALQDLYLEFEIYPTFGSKVIAKGVASPLLFEHIHSAKINGATCAVPLLDPRLQAVGQVIFDFTVIKPFSGVQFDIHSRIDTYWKSTQTIAASKSGTQTQRQHLVTESSLAGEYLWLPVQVTKDHVPFVASSWRVPAVPMSLTINEISAAELEGICDAHRDKGEVLHSLAVARTSSQLQSVVRQAYIKLSEFLTVLHPSVNIHLQVLLPTASERLFLRVQSFIDVNGVVDGVLSIVFHHAEELKSADTNATRSIFFSSSNTTLCTALNWKQPNCNVSLICAI
ncbi:Ankyrin repeat protein nuc-2 [Taphrina deformans PYCC 5710]|uniref:Ankyrin repeat protein nuc-2 n=1 Tax=Taphrina deformans (strain PYCC 5710 / ATCC 11124 / CBS 356.35 / IMI 108563 / JCM 9778 / NBRC 8474) TaxID=1097556 RepID=R4XEW2_TAPDE|nr:Ankyrin repeat protein nuc-2 [Taphrina deformans PYCC 5710]|eukprot:CCG81907.2 Ankyrin repeat protein nuc-2 [Taphrina deformans PYCC 5710]